MPATAATPPRRNAARASRESHRRALAIFERLGTQTGQAAALGRLGILRSEAGRPVQAIEFHLRAAAIRLAFSAREATPDLRRLAELRAGLGDAVFDDALAQLLDADSHRRLIAILDECDQAAGERNE
ncbi:tetratricopeptide repeat protein [Dactylosporangium sp. CA-139066]|uniref:tetratricopeptide repeat protein n=1 Tax=Dactylosporangium sp. CA-139066 TaxID=3239930 RepID=UPI003D91BD19